MSSNPLPQPDPIAGVSVLVTDGDRVLLVRRGRDPNRGLWALPGGRIEPGESAEAAAIREVAEETGVTVYGLRQIDTVDVPARGKGEAAYAITVFAATPRLTALTPGDDAADARWAGPGDRDRLATTEGTRITIEKHGRTAHVA